MPNTRFRFNEWAAKIGTKTDCVVCMCNIYIYTYCIIYYIYIKSFLKKDKSKR